MINIPFRNKRQLFEDMFLIGFFFFDWTNVNVYDNDNHAG